MKKLILFLFYILCMSASTYAQTITISNGPGEEKKPCTSTVKNIVDTCKLQIQYQMTSIKDVKNPEKKTNNFMLLQIGNHLSKFSDYFKLKFDSLETVYAQQKMDEVEAMNKLMPIMRGTVSLNVMKDYPAGKISTYDRIPTSGSFYYEEDKISQQWNLVEQKDTIICGYPCKYATTTFRGRNYTAWYAPEISISDGPWKFWGLPGLILKISDNKNEYIFECVAIEKQNRINSIYIIQKDYYKTTREKFHDALKKYYENPSASYEAKGILIDGKPTGIKSRPYNPIELSE